MKSSIIFTLTIVGLMFVGWVISPPNALAKEIQVPGDFPTIAAAVFAPTTESGDVINVAATYVGQGSNVFGKSLKINGNGGAVINDGVGFGDNGFFLAGSPTNGSTITGFIFQGDITGAAVSARAVDDLTVSHNTVFGKDMGDTIISLGDCDRAVVSHNLLLDFQQDGITFSGGEKGVIIHNKLFSESDLTPAGPFITFTVGIFLRAPRFGPPPAGFLISQNRIEIVRIPDDFLACAAIGLLQPFDTIVSFNDLRGLSENCFDIGRGGIRTIEHRNLSDDAGNRGEDPFTDINPSEVLFPLMD